MGTTVWFIHSDKLVEGKILLDLAPRGKLVVDVGEEVMVISSSSAYHEKSSCVKQALSSLFVMFDNFYKQDNVNEMYKVFELIKKLVGEL